MTAVGVLAWFDNVEQSLARIEDGIKRLGRMIMAAVQIQQEDLDSVTAALLALVTKLNDVDLTPLPAADQSGLVSAVADVTDAVNRVTGPTVADVPAPNPEPEPTPTPEPEPPAEEAPAEG